MQKVRRLQPDGTRGPWEYVGTGETPEEKIKRLEKEKENLEKTVSALGQAVAHEKVMGVQKDMLLQEIGKEVTTLKVQLITSKGGE